MLNEIRQQLEHTFNKELLDKLIDEYQLVNENYHLGKYRPCSLEAGRLSEIVLRMLQEVITGTFIPLGQQIIKFNAEVTNLEKADASKFPQSIRLQIPRTLQVLYDIRNKRDVGHVGGDVDANYTDATLSLNCCNWIMTELIRIYYTSDIDKAQNMVSSIIRMRIPLIQDFNGFLKILKPNLKVPDKVLALLYYRGSEGAKTSELDEWLKGRVTPNHLRITLNNLEHEKAFIHRNNDYCLITETGIKYVEENVDLKI